MIIRKRKTPPNIAYKRNRLGKIGRLWGYDYYSKEYQRQLKGRVPTGMMNNQNQNQKVKDKEKLRQRGRETYRKLLAANPTKVRAQQKARMDKYRAKLQALAKERSGLIDELGQTYNQLYEVMNERIQKLTEDNVTLTRIIYDIDSR